MLLRSKNYDSFLNFDYPSTDLLVSVAVAAFALASRLRYTTYLAKINKKRGISIAFGRAPFSAAGAA